MTDLTGIECITGAVVWMIMGSHGPGPMWAPMQSDEDWLGPNTREFYLETHKELYEVLKSVGVPHGSEEFHTEYYWKENWRGELVKRSRKVRRTPFVLPPALHFPLIKGDVKDGKGLDSPGLELIKKGYEPWICVW